MISKHSFFSYLKEMQNFIEHETKGYIYFNAKMIEIYTFFHNMYFHEFVLKSPYMRGFQNILQSKINIF